MFTGIILKVGQLVSLERTNPPVLTVAVDLPGRKPGIGDSLAVNGVCLTVIAAEKSHFRFQVSAETLSRSNFADLDVGAPVNIEPPLSLTDPLGGHLVSGHVDGMVRLRSISRGRSRQRFVFTYQEKEWQPLLLPKGSVALNGVSLTVIDVHPTWFDVEIIPHTLQTSNIGRLRLGERVNIELDLIGKYLYNFVQRRK